MFQSQVLSFLVGAIFAPSPNNSEQLLAVKCHDPDGPGYDSERSETKWFTPRVKGGRISINKIAETAEHRIMITWSLHSLDGTFEAIDLGEEPVVIGRSKLLGE